MKTYLVYFLRWCRDLSKDQDLGRKVTSSSANVSSTKHENVCLFIVLFLSPPIVYISYLLCISCFARIHLVSKRIPIWQDNAFLFFLCLLMYYVTYFIFKRKEERTVILPKVASNVRNYPSAFQLQLLPIKKLNAIATYYTMPHRENVMVLLHGSWRTWCRSCFLNFC